MKILICETLVEAVEPYIFKTDNCCVNTRIINVEHELISVEMNETDLSMEGSLIESLGNSDHVKDEAGNGEHCDKTLAKCKEEIELLERFLGGNGNRKEVVTRVLNSRRGSLKDMEIEECFGSRTNSLFAGTMHRMNECDVVIEEI